MVDFSNPKPHDFSRPQPEIDTVWFDVSTVLIMRPGFVSGITRTIYKIVEAWAANPWTKIRFCAFVPDQGLAEVCPAFLHRHMYQYDQNAPTRVHVEEDEVEPPRQYSRYWYIPWAMRHQFRSVERVVKGGVTKFCIDPNPPQVREAVARPHLPPYAPNALIGLIDPGPRDLLFSLGGLWVFSNFAGTISKIRQRDRFHFVSLIYDLIPIITPQHVPDHFWVQHFAPSTDAQLRESAVTLTISKHSKQDILNYARERFLPIGPVEIFTLGCDISPMGDTTPNPQRGHTRPFVLSVGTIESRKNHYGMYQAWRKLIKTLGPDRCPDLVFAGKAGPHSDDLLYMIKHDPLVKDKIIVKSNDLPDRELDWLYKNCLFTLYPSLYEGWGLPVEESFIYGKMCITTNVTSLPEVGGEFADYVEAEDVDGIVQAVIKGLDPAYRRGRESLIREKYKANTWKQAGAKLQEILQSYYSFPEDRARRKDGAKAPSRSKLARAMSFFW